MSECKEDMVNSPRHYMCPNIIQAMLERGNVEPVRIEAINVIEGWGLDFNLGNSVKYILRAGIKGGDKEKHIQDLEKAIYYLKREVHHLKNNLTLI